MRNRFLEAVIARRQAEHEAQIEALEVIPKAPPPAPTPKNELKANANQERKARIAAKEVQIRALHAQRKTDQQIAEAMGVPQHEVRRIRLRMGLISNHPPEWLGRAS